MQGRGQPASPRQHMAHAYETLQYLAADPRVDRERIGIMGFSWGGMIALLTSSTELTRKYTGEAASIRRAPGHLSHLLAP